MQVLQESTGQNSFIAIVVFLPGANMARTGDRHVVNLKFIPEIKHFTRIDGNEPFPSLIGPTDSEYFASAQEIDIYAMSATDVTYGMLQKNSSRVSASMYFDFIGLDLPTGYPDYQDRASKARRHNQKRQDPLHHPQATKRCVDYWVGEDAKTYKENKSKAGSHPKKGKHL